jgi:formate--tetrahydrofolate ligase
MYGAGQVHFTKVADCDIQEINRLGYSALPVCIAKMPSTLLGDSRSGKPHAGFDITVQQLQVNSGAGFLVVLTGDILRMPGLPREPLAQSIDLVDGNITGLQ